MHVFRAKGIIGAIREVKAIVSQLHRFQATSFALLQCYQVSKAHLGLAQFHLSFWVDPNSLRRTHMSNTLTYHRVRDQNTISSQMLTLSEERIWI